MLGCAYGHSTPSAHGPWEPNISSGCNKSVTILHSNRGGLKVIFGCEFKRNPLSSLNERCPWKSWAKTSLSQPGTEKEDVKRDAIFGVTDCCRKNRTRQCGFFRCFWNNNEMSHISKEMRGKSEGGRKGERERESEGRRCFYRRQCCEAKKPSIDKRGLSYSAHQRTFRWTEGLWG